MNLELAKKFEHRSLGVVDERGQCFESLEALEAWENSITEHLARASGDIAAERTYSLAEARRMVADKLEKK